MSGRPRQRSRVLLGTAIILALLGCGIGIFFLDDLVALLRSSYHVVAVLPEAPRVGPGSPVWVGGKEVGRVRTVGLLPAQADSTARVVLVLELPGRVRPQVRRDSRVRITSLNVMGAPVVDISPGSPDQRVIGPGDTLRGPARIHGPDLMARARQLRADLDSALAPLDQLRAPAAQRLTALRLVQGRLDSAGLAYRQLRQTLAASPLLGAWQSGELSAALARSQAEVSEMVAALEQLRARARATGLASEATELGEHAAALRRSFALLQDSMQMGGGTLDRLARDSALVKAIAGARAALDSLLADSRRRPLRYVF